MTFRRPAAAHLGVYVADVFAQYMTLCGTDEWMAPEVMLGEKYDEKADVYSFGMVRGVCGRCLRNAA